MGTFKGGRKLKVEGILFRAVNLKFWAPSAIRYCGNGKGSTPFIFFLGLISTICFPCFIWLRMNQGHLLCECPYLRKYFLKKVLGETPQPCPTGVVETM